MIQLFLWPIVLFLDWGTRWTKHKVAKDVWVQARYFKGKPREVRRRREPEGVETGGIMLCSVCLLLLGL